MASLPGFTPRETPYPGLPCRSPAVEGLPASRRGPWTTCRAAFRSAISSGFFPYHHGLIQTSTRTSSSRSAVIGPSSDQARHDPTSPGWHPRPRSSETAPLRAEEVQVPGADVRQPEPLRQFSPLRHRADCDQLSEEPELNLSPQPRVSRRTAELEESCRPAHQRDRWDRGEQTDGPRALLRFAHAPPAQPPRPGPHTEPARRLVP